METALVPAVLVLAVLLIFALYRLSRVERRLRAVTDRLGIQDPGAAASDPLGVPAPAPPVIDGPPTPMDGVDDLLAQGRKIEAIKLYRERTGVGLKQARDAVEARARARGL